MIQVNGREIFTKLYPNNEYVAIDSILPHLTLNDNNIYCRFDSDADLIHLMIVKRWIDDVTPYKTQTNLIMPYMPYSRMDRSENDSAFSLKYVAEFINNLNFNNVYIYEAHSFMTQALIKNIRHVDKSVTLATNICINNKLNSDTYIFFPDEGAKKRYGKQMTTAMRIITANKVRDFKTGEIKGLEIQGAEDLQGNSVVIVDDLCSAGGSFYYSALALKEKGAGDIYLAVTHCENTIHKGKLLNTDLIKEIYTTDSILTQSHKKIKIFEIHKG